ncbi:MAG: DUF4198 domain-containing protein, partial [Bacteroidota bacterium]
ENVIDRDRMIDVSLVQNGERTELDTSQWREEGVTTLLDLRTGEEGTYVVGLSTRARNIEMAAEDFNNYLDHDGVLDMLEYRRENDLLGQDAVEKYSKHVKTIFQVGAEKTDDWQTVLGYPIEFVPLGNPYNLHVDEELEVQLLWQGEPLADQLVYVGNKPSEHAHSHDHGSGHSHDHGDDHSHDHDSGHSHSHGDDHGHDHESGHSHSHGDDHSLDHDSGHGHSHGDDHSHDHDSGHGHSHGDNHSHDHDSGHSHSHEGDHGHDHDSGHSHSHEGDHGHDHDSGHSHDHVSSQAHSHAEDQSSTHTHGEAQFRTNAEGKLAIPITSGGVWYLKTIHLEESDEEGLTHESNWATLTFSVGHDHSHADGHGHDHEHDHAHDHEEGGIPGYAYWLASLLLVGVLFLVFSRSNKE